MAFVAPNLALFLLFTYWPLVHSFYLSLTQGDLLGRNAAFVGLAHYSSLMRDPVFWKVVLNTLIYAATVVLIAQTIAFFLALLLNQPIRGRTFFRTLAFTPHVTTTAAAAVVWLLLLDPRLGPLSYVYDVFGIEGPRWASSPSLALPALMVVGIWKEIGFATVFFLAGLQSLPEDLYEAAELEGASRWVKLRSLTLPLMGPLILFLAISGFIAATKAFDLVAIMTQGGPTYPDSSTYVYHLYKLAFQESRFEYACAFAVVFFVVVVAITGLKFRIAGRRVWYGD